MKYRSEARKQKEKRRAIGLEMSVKRDAGKFNSVQRGREGWRDEMRTEGWIEEGLRSKKDEAKIEQRGSEREEKMEKGLIR